MSLKRVKNKERPKKAKKVQKGQKSLENVFCLFVCNRGDTILHHGVNVFNKLSFFSDCSPPFMVGIFTNAFDADDDADGAIDEDADGAVTQSRGLCLNYLQKPC